MEIANGMEGLTEEPLNIVQTFFHNHYWGQTVDVRSPLAGIEPLLHPRWLRAIVVASNKMLAVLPKVSYVYALTFVLARSRAAPRTLTGESGVDLDCHATAACAPRHVYSSRRRNGCAYVEGCLVRMGA